MHQHSDTDIASFSRLIRTIPDFPEPGIQFRDITPLLANADAFRQVVDLMAEPYQNIGHIVSIESRGFIFGAPIAYCLGAGLIPVRKSGKLPFTTLSEAYSLEYGTNSVEIHTDAIQPGEKVVIVDDLLATGGTVKAAVSLIERLGAVVDGICVLIELEALGGRERLDGYTVHSQIVY